VSRRQYRDFCFLDLFAVSILHFVISCHQQPAIPVAEAYDLGVLDVSLDISILIAKPLRKSLNCESGCSQADGDRFGCKAFIEKEDAFLTPLFDVDQGALALFPPCRGLSRNP